MGIENLHVIQLTQTNGDSVFVKTKEIASNIYTISTTGALQKAVTFSSKESSDIFLQKIKETITNLMKIDKDVNNRNMMPINPMTAGSYGKFRHLTPNYTPLPTDDMFSILNSNARIFSLTRPNILSNWISLGEDDNRILEQLQTLVKDTPVELTFSITNQFLIASTSALSMSTNRLIDVMGKLIKPII